MACRQERQGKVCNLKPIALPQPASGLTLSCGWASHTWGKHICTSEMWKCIKNTPPVEEKAE